MFSLGNSLKYSSGLNDILIFVVYRSNSQVSEFTLEPF